MTREESKSIKVGDVLYVDRKRKVRGIVKECIRVLPNNSRYPATRACYNFIVGQFIAETIEDILAAKEKIDSSRYYTSYDHRNLVEAIEVPYTMCKRVD